MHLNLLKGLRVVESSAFIAAPLAGMTLAQSGADVIRIDLIGGGIDYARLPRVPDGRSLYWTGLNKGKRSLAVDFRRPEGREIVEALVTAPGENGGVLLTNIAASWLTHDALRKSRPDLISCTIEGNNDGSTAVDYTVNCAAGFPLMTGDATRERPVNHLLPAWDVACAYQAAFAVTAAVARRRETGEGAQLRLALSDVAFSTLNHLGMTAEVEILGEERHPIGTYLYGAFGRDFRCADGERLYVVGISAGQWRALVAATDSEKALAALERRLGLTFVRESDRYLAREAIAAVLEPWFASRTLAEAKAALDGKRATWGAYQTVRKALAEDPRLSVDNPIFSLIDTPGVGRHLAAGSAIRATHEAASQTRPAAILGEHTDAILADILGLSSGAIARLHDLGLVAGPARDPLMPGADFDV